MSLLQAEVERRGTQIFDLVDRHPESIFSKAGFYQRMMEFSMRDEHLKVQMFRFVDVLASLRRGSDIVQHLDEYFADMRNGYAPLIRTGVSLARIAPFISGKLLRWNVSGMARQFIAGRNPDDVMKTLRKRARRFHQFRNGKLRAQKRDPRTVSNAFHRAGVSRLATRRHRHSSLLARRGRGFG